VDDAYQFSVFDVAFASGGVGLFARATGDTPVSVSYSDLQVYNLSGSLAVPTPRGFIPTRSLPTTTPEK
jgi:hypothetical protein